jgi:hypothetical protein
MEDIKIKALLEKVEKTRKYRKNNAELYIKIDD